MSMFSVNQANIWWPFRMWTWNMMAKEIYDIYMNIIYIFISSNHDSIHSAVFWSTSALILIDVERSNICHETSVDSGFACRVDLVWPIPEPRWRIYVYLYSGSLVSFKLVAVNGQHHSKQKTLMFISIFVLSFLSSIHLPSRALPY